MLHDGIGELETTPAGEIINLHPDQPCWLSLAEQPKADENFLQERPAVIGDEGRNPCIQQRT